MIFFLLRFNILFSISYHKFSSCKIVLKNRKRKINSKKNVESHYYVIRMFIRCLIYFFHFRTDINNFFIFIFILVYRTNIDFLYVIFQCQFGLFTDSFIYFWILLWFFLIPILIETINVFRNKIFYILFLPEKI